MDAEALVSPVIEAAGLELVDVTFTVKKTLRDRITDRSVARLGLRRPTGRT